MKHRQTMKGGKTMKKRSYSLGLILLFCGIITGCGKVQSAKSLIKQAERTYGKCEVVSKTEEKDHVKVVLRDELQGFEYEVYSNMNDIVIDGSSFGSLPNSGDTFSGSLIAYVTGDAKKELDAICEKYSLKPESENHNSSYFYLYLDSNAQESTGIKGAEEIAAVIQRYNLNNRLDGTVITLYHDDEWMHQYYETLKQGYTGEDIYSDPEYSYVLSSSGGNDVRHIGSVKLPDTSFRDREKESEDYYLEMAQMKNTKAVFVRSEKKTFADTGLSLDRVEQTYYQPYPKTMSDPVTFYYFSADGREFFICDFLDTNLQTTTWYSNYEDVFE